MISLKEQGGILFDVVDAVSGEDGVVVDPLHHLEGREHLAVVEASCSRDWVGGGSAHHGRLRNHLRFVVTLSVLHESPDPERSFVVRTLVVSSHKFLALSVVVVSSSLADTIVGPFDGLIVDFSTSVANFVSLMEVSVSIATLDLDSLSGANLGLHFGGRDRVVSSVEHIEEVVLVLGDSHGLEHTWLANISSTFSVDLWEMDRCDGLDTVEVVVVEHRDI